MNKTLKVLILIAALGISGTANAALVSRLGGQAVYDTDLNVTWLTDASLSASNTFGVSVGSHGLMNWTVAQSWIGAMNAANYLGYSDWRLPSTMQPDATCSLQFSGVSQGYNCTGSEMGHLYYKDMGGTTAGINPTNSNFSLFSNFMGVGGNTTQYYWSGTEYAPNGSYAWNFGFANSIDYSTSDGIQGATLKDGVGMLALVVRPGDVAAVPLPAAVWLFGSGLMGLIGVARRRRTQV